MSAEMAPYLQSAGETSKSELVKQLEEKNQKQLDEYEQKIKQAEEDQGDSEVSELWRNKAMYLCRIGDKVSLLNCCRGVRQL